MNKIAIAALSTLLAVVPFALPVAYGQGGPSGTGAEASPLLRRHQQMSELMRDMSAQMNQMADEMSKGEMSPTQAKEMTARMDRMSKSMRSMSGLIDRPAMKDAEAEKRMAQMRRDMGMMEKAHPDAKSSK